MKYPHLKLVDWPFRVVPDETFYSFLADRAQLSRDIDDFLRNLSRRTAASMHLMWAWYGAGKTHSLRHIEYLCKSVYQTLTPVYTEFPRATRNFLDLYRLFVSRIDVEKLLDAFMEVFTNPDRPAVYKDLQYDYPDFLTILKKLAGGNDQEQSIAIRWLRGEISELRPLKSIGVGRPLSTAEQATTVISAVVRLLGLASSAPPDRAGRIVWMIDEYQRIRDCRAPAQTEINGCLHSIFNRCPNFLSIVLSFSGRPEDKKLPAWLSREIKDRIGVEKVFLLPPLSTEEAERFVFDVLAHFRIPSSSQVAGYFPFTTESIREVLKTIDTQGQLKPRSIMQFFNAVLEEADPHIENGDLQQIDVQFVRNVLRNRVILDDEEKQE